jgi:hypothetical protein
MPFSASALAQAAESPGFEEPPPPADYEAAMYKADVFESKAGENFVRLHYRVLGGPHRDHEWAAIHPIDAESAGLGVTAQVLTNLGIDVLALANAPGSGIIELRKALDKVEGASYLVEVKRRGQYVNSMPKRTIEQRLADAGPEPEVAPGQTYGQAPPRNAILGPEDDAPRPRRRSQEPPQAEQLTPRSDVPQTGFEAPPERGSVDPETGEVIPF